MVLIPFVSDANELTNSHGQSHKDDDDSAVYSQNQCMSSMSDESYKKFKESQMKPILFMGNPSFGIHNFQHAHVDHYLNAGYGSHPMIQPHLVHIAPTRVPLPPDLSEDGPIYVNAKQYHGIIRRRQIRAKLEAQNKLVKNRKPYLHESRHKHALKRVRGSGGRFLPTKQTVNRFLSCSDSHSSGSGSEHVMVDHGFSWG